MLLSQIKSGTTVILKEILADRLAKAKLSSMGLLPGVEFKVIRNDVAGPVIIAIKNSRFVLGRGLSCKIKVTISTVHVY